MLNITRKHAMIPMKIWECREADNTITQIFRWNSASAGFPTFLLLDKNKSTSHWLMSIIQVRNGSSLARGFVLIQGSFPLQWLRLFGSILNSRHIFHFLKNSTKKSGKGSRCHWLQSCEGNQERQAPCGYSLVKVIGKSAAFAAAFWGNQKRSLLALALVPVFQERLSLASAMCM